MDSLITLLIVKTFRTLKANDDYSQANLESVLVKLESVSALEGLYFPNYASVSEKRLLTYWAPYFKKEGQTVEGAVRYLRAEAEDFSRRVCELCLLFGIELSDDEKLLEYHRYLLLGSLGLTITELKFSCTVVFDLFYDQSLPSPTPFCLGLQIFPDRLARRLRLWSKSAVARRNPKKQYLINTVFMGFKKGLLPTRPDAIQSSLEKHRAALTKDGSIPVELSDKIERILEEFVSELDLRLGHGDSKQSSKSTMESSYGEGGNIGHAYRQLFKDELTVHEPEFVGFSRIKTTGVEPCQTNSFRRRLWGAENGLGPVYISRYLPARDVIEVLDTERFLKGLSRCFYGTKVVPAYVLEPMKVRIITKPEVSLHSKLHKFQHCVWKALKNHRSGFFDLIGEPVERVHLWPIVDRWVPGELFCSGDFSAATDNLKAEISRTIIRHVFGRYLDSHPMEYQTIVNSMLDTQVCQTETTFPTYKDPFLQGFSYDKLIDFQQTNGQLMGNVISFVVLCIANYLAYHISWEDYLGRQIPCFNVPAVRINGDDILFKTDHRHYDLWKNRTAEFGFELSPGKNFLSDRILQINSKLFRLDTTVVYSRLLMTDYETSDHEIYCESFPVNTLFTIEEVGYANFGLITNRKKQDCDKDFTVKSSDLLTDVSDCAGRIKVLPAIRREVLKLCPNDLKTILMSLVDSHTEFLTYHYGLKFLNHYRYLGLDEFFDILVPNTLIVDDYGEIFDDQKGKLSREKLEFDWKAVKLIRKQISATDGLCFIQPINGTEDSEPVLA